jgi:K(+)-stimulated pyrophosphate-energized sodium pump
MNILIKLSCLVGLTLAPMLGSHSKAEDHGGTTNATTINHEVVQQEEVKTVIMMLPEGKARVTTTTSQMVDGHNETETSSEVRDLTEAEKAQMGSSTNATPSATN